MGQALSRARRLSGAALVAFLAFAPGDVRAAPEPDAPPITRARFEVDTSSVGDAGPILKRRFDERGGSVLRDEHVVPGDGSSAVIRFRVAELDGDSPGFELDATIERGGVAVPGTTSAVVCTLCTEGELIDRFEQELHRLIGVLRAQEAADATAPPTGDAATGENAESDAASSDAVATDRDEADPVDRGDRAGDPRPLRWAGVASASVGAVGLGLAIGGAAAGQAAENGFLDMTTGEDRLAADRRGRAHNAMAIAGAVLAGVGAAGAVTLFVLDARRGRTEVAMRPGGVVVTARF